MKFSKGQVVKVNLNHGWTTHGRVISVSEDGEEAQARFRVGNDVIISTVIPEMLAEPPFWCDGTGTYGV